MRPSRPSRWPCYLVSLALVLVLSTGSTEAQNVTVLSTDARLEYHGTWIDQDNGGHKFTGEKGAYVSLTFQGAHFPHQCIELRSWKV
jgi:hypothetical protein